MSGKHPVKKGKPAKSEPMVEFKFSDGVESLSAVEVQRQLQRQYHAMATSDHPELRTKGRQRLLDVAKKVVRDGSRQGGTKKLTGAKRPETDALIERLLQKYPNKTAAELFKLVPEDGGKVYMDDGQIHEEGLKRGLGFSGFKKRVGEVKEHLGISKRR